MKRRGPRTEPWGTPKVTRYVWDVKKWSRMAFATVLGMTRIKRFTSM